MRNKLNVERLLMQKIGGVERPGLGSKRSEDSWMLEKIQQLEEQVMENQRRMMEHKQLTELQIIT